MAASNNKICGIIIGLIGLATIAAVIVVFTTGNSASSTNSAQQSKILVNSNSTTSASGLSPKLSFSAQPLKSLNWCGDRQVVALTFDDGPDVVKTPTLLRDLETAGIKATFYVTPAVGLTINDDPDPSKCGLIETILQFGHSVQSHSWDHSDFTGLSNDEILIQLQKTQDWIYNCAGSSKDKLKLTQFRPPQGLLDGGRAQFISGLGYTVATWTVDSEDYTGQRDREGTYKHIMDQFNKKLESGDSVVIIMHDSHYSKEGSEGIVFDLYNHFNFLGYRFVTMDQCYADCTSFSSICKKEGVWPGTFEV